MKPLGKRFFAFFLFLLILKNAHASTSDEISLRVIKTGETAPTLEAMVVSSGSLFKIRQLTHNAILITHPKGNILFDTGLGKVTNEAFAKNSFLNRQLFKYENINPAIEQLAASDFDLSSIKAIIPSHLHWDHTGGLPDFENIPVWIQKHALEHAHNNLRPAYLPEQIDSPDIQWHYFELESAPYKSFERSKDLYGDGSIVLVDLAGHTPGQVGLFLKTSDGKEYFFIGDTTWTMKGIEDGSPRPMIAQFVIGIDWERESNTNHILKIKALKEAEPNLIIVPAHDEVVNAALPAF